MLIIWRETQFVGVEWNLFRAGAFRFRDSRSRAFLSVVNFGVSGEIHLVVAQFDGIDEELAIVGGRIARDVYDRDWLAVFLSPPHWELKLFASGGQLVRQLQYR